MACPFFRPAGTLEDEAWLKPPRLPLGDPCRGVCTAVDPPAEPEISVLREMCNVGYARERCARFPTSAHEDAIRFSVSFDRDGTVNLMYIFEKDYSPLRHGTLDYDVSAGSFLTMLPDQNVNVQAQQFIAGYLKRKVKS